MIASIHITSDVYTDPYLGLPPRLGHRVHVPPQQRRWHLLDPEHWWCPADRLDSSRLFWCPDFDRRLVSHEHCIQSEQLQQGSRFCCCIPRVYCHQQDYFRPKKFAKVRANVSILSLTVVATMVY